jgi:HEAT repeat protein
MSAPAVARARFADSDPVVNAVRMFEIFLKGREPDRNQADHRLGNASYPVDRDELRHRLVEHLQANSGPGGPMMKPGRDLASTRAWLLYALGRVGAADPEAVAVLERHLDPASEPDRWVRYWTLAGLARSGAPVLAKLAELALKDPEQQVSMAGLAIRAAAGDEQCLGVIRQGLEDPDDNVRWPALRALRVVTIDDEIVVQKLIDIIERGDNSDITYDAIRAVRHIGAGSRFARDAARSLATFVERWRTFTGRDSMRAQALIGLGKLKVEATAPVLVEELLDYNPGIVREAAISLESTLGARTAVARVLEAASKSEGATLPAYARGLSWLEDREAVAAELASAMGANDVGQQEIARSLLSEVGGLAAFEKLRAQSNMMVQHAQFIRDSEEKMQGMFTQSIADARSGFVTSLRMDVAVFVLGIGLIAASGALQLAGGGTLDVWAGASGAAGVLGVLYSLLVAKPRQRVEEAVDHLMHLKIVFLGYLRQLHQADQAYIRRLIEDKPIATEELQSFAAIVDSNMKSAAAQLKAQGAGGTKA